MNMTTTTPTSSSDYVRQHLKSFLAGEISLPELEDALRGVIHLDFHDAPNQRSIADLSQFNHFEIVVTKDHLCKILKKYQQGSISKLDLSNWAAIIYMLPYFRPEGETDEDRWREGGGPLWEIIQRLASPFSSFEVDNQDIDDYINLLSCE